ncbi:P-loop containing nucleoside triphosphate hydrolase protein [Thelonectria olida]|uniref:P-loop containing nucleoside triphosphate hydrolase protein n=1 Tax=Thelonectria olida TaxID=1576542 RepID=A0A9P9AR46_9HYPO|nr:P-loop containing nucleoside triphosphate hydrolase protein [Thelonectria olida]
MGSTEGSIDNARARRRLRRKHKQLLRTAGRKPYLEPQPSDGSSDEVDACGEGSDGDACELQEYEHRFDTRGQMRPLRVGTKEAFEFSKDPSHRAAIVLIRAYGPSRNLLGIKLEIRSRHIRKALREVIGTYPSVSFHTSGCISVNDPPMCLFHYRLELEEYATHCGNPLAKAHINLCLDYVKSSLRQAISAFEAGMGAEKGPSIVHRDLWMAFKPGILIYQRINNTDVVLRLLRVESFKWAESDEVQVWILTAERIDYNGIDYGYIGHTINIKKYSGYKLMRELRAFPLECHPNKEKIRQNLARRGRKFVSLTGICHRFYDGIAHFYMDPSSTHTTKFNVKHRVMIDCKEFESQTNLMHIKFLPYTKLIETASKDHLSLSEEELLLCCHEVQGFSLVWRRWATLHVDNISEVQFNADAFDQLVFSEEKKNLIRSLVNQQHEDGAGFDDIIQGKGKGLVFLLHGPPGVGKTLTAESIADHTKRPLFSICSGQLVGPAPTVEQTLSRLLSLAERWQAVVLIDEADVFMQERTLLELERNGLVSILLRVLEYFEGTLFLTTNRAQTIDSAFRSRIHLSLAYPKLSNGALRALWENTIIRGCAGHRPRWLKDEFLDDLAKANVNGRDIKNIVRIAYAMGKNSRRKMKAKDIARGLAAFQAFNKDMSGNGETNQ